MIRSFSFRNLWSFEDEQLISFEVGKTPPEDNRFITTPREDRVSAALAIFGANASGKTNILKILAFMAWFIPSSWESMKPGEKIPFSKFHFSIDDTKNSSFSLIVETKLGIKYRYELVISNTSVETENLFTMNNESGKWNYLLKRSTLNNTENILIRGINITKNDIKKQIRSNASIISTIRQYDESGIEPFINLIGKFETNVGPGGRETTDHDFISLEALKRISDDEKYRESLSKYLAEFDTGLSSIVSQKIPEKIIMDIMNNVEIPQIEKDAIASFKHTKDAYIPIAVHVIDGKEYKIPFNLESDGTRQLLILLINIIMVLENGGLLIHDELELGLHPHIIPALLKLFFSKKTNPKGAQIILTTHSTDVMNELHKSQIVLVQKDDRCRSHAWRLDEMKGVRIDDNILAKYHSGAYGAIPSL
jgi:hypothetical protein